LTKCTCIIYDLYSFFFLFGLRLQLQGSLAWHCVAGTRLDVLLKTRVVTHPSTSNVPSERWPKLSLRQRLTKPGSIFNINIKIIIIKCLKKINCVYVHIFFCKKPCIKCPNISYLYKNGHFKLYFYRTFFQHDNFNI